MNESFQKILYLLGSIVVIYILFKYLLPILLKILGFAFQAFFFVIMWVAIAFVVILLVVHIIDMFKK